ncbi:MAG: Lpg1974 family pore-forming outer membrane protein [Candidatus Algichlamydia australiensis]|nr:Lpg1974 family pore-forming outer membrane protein [Chlamydiales bacterium]
MKIKTLIFLLAIAFVMADQLPATSCDVGCPPPKYEPPCCDEQGAYKYFASVSYLYWQPLQENMILGVVSDNANALDLVNGNEVDLDFKYKPGFKICLGMDLDYDGWDTSLEYTWFRATADVQVNLDPNNIPKKLFPAWQIPSFLNPQYNFGSEKWTLQMHLIDWDLARMHAIGPRLCFKPFIGLRFAIIDQDLDIDYVNTNPADFFIFPSTHIDLSSDSWGIGPRVGLFTNWVLGKGWRLYGNGGLDILYTQYDLESEQNTEVAVANRIIVNHDNANYLRTHLDLNLGFGWGRGFSCDRYYVDLSADYGVQVFFDQNMLRTAVSAQSIGRSFLPNGNLYVHGLIVNLRVGF